MVPMIEQGEDQYPWVAVPDDLMLKVESRIAELSEEEIADPKCHPLGAGPKNQKNESERNENLSTNEKTSGGPWSEENSSKFILRKNGYIIEDKLVTPPGPLPEPFLFSGETMSRIALRRLGYKFTDEIVSEEEKTGTAGTSVLKMPLKNKTTKSKKQPPTKVFTKLPKTLVLRNVPIRKAAAQTDKILPKGEVDALALAEGIKAIQTGEN